MYSAILDFTEKAGVDVLILGESQIYMQMAACMLSIPQQAACMVMQYLVPADWLILTHRSHVMHVLHVLL